MKTASDRTVAEKLDAADPLAPLRAKFHLPLGPDGSPRVYFCGHSLGLAPKRAAAIVTEELEAWAREGVAGHFTGPRPWVAYHEQLTQGFAELAGAQPIEVVAMNSLTVNLHLLLAGFYRPTRARHKILIEARAFPSDRYAVASQIRHHGFDPAEGLVEIAPRAGEDVLRTEDICEHIERHGAEIAVVLLPGVQYLSGQLLDMQAITACAHRQGCLVGFDLAHAIGNVPLNLHDWDVDFAAWCGYKYLNGGPGAIGGCFVHERHAHADLPRFAGWWGHDKATRFDMPQAFSPLPGAEGWQISNPPILSAAPLLASLELFEAAGMAALRRKSLDLTAYLVALLREHVYEAVSILTPDEADARGCQLSLRLNRAPHEARAIHDALTDRGMVCDWREPDVIRVAPVPLYNTFTEVWDFVAALKALL